MSCPWKRALERGLNNVKEICHQEDYRLPRGSAGNYRNRAVCSCHSDQPVIPYAEVTHGDAEK